MGPKHAGTRIVSVNLHPKSQKRVEQAIVGAKWVPISEFLFESTFTFSSASKALNAVDPTPRKVELLKKALLAIKRSNSLRSILKKSLNYLVIVS